MKQLTLTIEAAAVTLGMGSCSIRKLIRLGELKGVRTPDGHKLMVSAFSVLNLLGAPPEVYQTLATAWLADLVKPPPGPQWACHPFPPGRPPTARNELAPTVPAERGAKVVDDAMRMAKGNNAGGPSPKEKALRESFWRTVCREEARLRGGPPRTGAAQRRGVK